MSGVLAEIDWPALERLRAAFLAGTAGQNDYWKTEAELASYDATFAQRIGWKWDYVLGELARRGWTPPPGEILDWGCGTGIAGRAFLNHFGTGSTKALNVWDRSSLAMRFAAERARTKYPGLTVTSGLVEAPAVLLLSHVLTELDAAATAALVELVARASAVLWIEPGTYETSLTLIAIRERLRDRLNLVAPCPHQGQCGILAPGNERHWCHHFASPPPAIFTDRDWSQFARMTGIDLRSLPLSYLVLDQRPVPTLPPGATRVIGRPRIYKPYASVLGCDAAGVHERQLTKRAHPEEYRRWKKDAPESLQVWTYAGDQITAVESLPAGVEE